MTRLPPLSLCVVPPQQVARHVSSVVPQRTLSALARRQAMNEKQRAQWSPVQQPALRRSQAQRLPLPRVAEMWPLTPWFASSQSAPAPVRALRRVLRPVNRHRVLPMDRLGMGALSSRRWRTHSLLLALATHASQRATAASVGAASRSVVSDSPPTFLRLINSCVHLTSLRRRHHDLHTVPNVEPVG